MRKVTTSALLLALVGCSEQVDESYPTYADAQRAGAVDRGWVPAFVPASARDIRDTHNLDTNRQTLRFAIPPSQVATMVSGLRTVSPKDKRAAAKLSREHGFGAASEAFVVCSDILNGVLAVDRESGRTVYDTTIDWTDDDCFSG